MRIRLWLGHLVSQEGNPGEFLQKEERGSSNLPFNSFPQECFQSLPFRPSRNLIKTTNSFSVITVLVCILKLNRKPTHMHLCPHP